MGSTGISSVPAQVLARSWLQEWLAAVGCDSFLGPRSHLVGVSQLWKKGQERGEEEGRRIRTRGEGDGAREKNNRTKETEDSGRQGVLRDRRIGS